MEAHLFLPPDIVAVSKLLLETREDEEYALFSVKVLSCALHIISII